MPCGCSSRTPGFTSQFWLAPAASITDGFVAGSNTLSFDVRNLREVAENFNPTGMQVQLSGTYAVPEPTGMGLAASGLAVAGGFGIRRRFLSRQKPDQLPA